MTAVPSTWRQVRVGDIAELVNGYPFDSSDFSSDGDVPLVRIRDLLQGDYFRTFVPVAATPPGVIVRDGDVVIGMDGDFNCQVWQRGPAALNQRLCLLTNPRDADLRFVAYALPRALRKINDLTYATTVKHLSSGQVRRIRIVVPAFEEQRAIADYLDRETTRIDRLIAKQERLIETLRERRLAAVDQVVWHGVVTRPEGPTGLDVEPSAPRHWERMRNKHLLRERNEYASDADRPTLLTVSHLTGVTRRDSKIVNMFEALSLDGYRVVDTGDVVVNTMWAWMGALGVAREKGVVSPAYGVYAVTGSREVSSDYLGFLFASRPYVMEMTRRSTGIWSSRLRLYPESFLAMPMVLPPIEEQHEIVAHLNDQIAKIDLLIAKTERFIELSRERRSALITAAVTGQIDVREAA